MDLPSFIRAAGVPASAVLFDATESAVKTWLYRERYPRPTKGHLIEERTRDHPVGHVTLAEIYAKRPEPSAGEPRAAAA